MKEGEEYINKFDNTEKVIIKETFLRNLGRTSKQWVTCVKYEITHNKWETGTKQLSGLSIGKVKEMVLEQFLDLYGTLQDIRQDKINSLYE